MTERMAYLTDLDNPYITLENDYIESVWWILDKFNKEGYIYEGHKILPYCARCGTGLASHEVAQGYEEIKTSTVYVKFKRKDVIDCWFDSGAMPYAQQHYPFENKENFEAMFSADFICEGIDQTRGWFYSLIAISTFVMGKLPYKRVLVNDLILDKYGKKMSKTKGNTVNPFDMFDKYGADALRWYLLYVSPAWTLTKFDVESLKEIMSKFFGTVKNVYNFFVLYANTDGINPNDFQVEYKDRPELDRWILS